MTGEEIIVFIKNNKLENGEVSICVDSYHLDAKEYWETDYETKNIRLAAGCLQGLLISSKGEWED